MCLANGLNVSLLFLSTSQRLCHSFLHYHDVVSESDSESDSESIIESLT